MRKNVAWIVAALVFLIGNPLVARNKAGQGEESQRQRALIIADIETLESEPVGNYARSLRFSELKWLVKQEDMEFPAYLEPLIELPEDRSRWQDERSILVAQMIFSTAKYHLQNPEADREDFDGVVSGVEGTIAVYEALKQQSKKFRVDSLERYLAARDAGELHAILAEEIEGREYEALILVQVSTLEALRVQGR